MGVSRRATIAGLGTVALAPIAHTKTRQAQMPTIAEATAIAKGAWIYACPMMENYNTMYLQAVDASRAPMWAASTNSATIRSPSRRPTGTHTVNLPPANFFWSMTLYTLPDRPLYANAIDRYSIGDRTWGSKYGADGALTLTVNHDPTADPDAKANWLPAPSAPYSLVARIYGPKPELMNGT